VSNWTGTAPRFWPGRIEINALTAQEVIVLTRPPQAARRCRGWNSPAPEAGGFALPELPVSVEIGRIAAERVVLGETVLGQQVEGRLDAGLTLSGGEGRAQLAILRTDDGPDGRVDLTASYANASQMLVIDLIATEGPGGIAASLLDLPAGPRPNCRSKAAGRWPILPPPCVWPPTGRTGWPGRSPCAPRLMARRALPPIFRAIWRRCSCPTMRPFSAMPSGCAPKGDAVCQVPSTCRRWRSRRGRCRLRA
jgi:hypothetical protein